MRWHWQGNWVAVILAALVAAVVLTALDAATETLAWQAPGLVLDVLDRLFLLLAAVAILKIGLGQAELRVQSTQLGERLALESAEAAHWRARSQRLYDDLSGAITDEFAQWALTPAESEIAGLLLKGLSLRDIAVLRRTSERTIRQQAQGIYRKSGMANRTEFAAYFLDGLFQAAEDSIPEPVRKGPLN